MNKSILFSAWLLLICASCGKKEGRLFVNPTPKETGITFINKLSDTENLNILDYLYFYNGGGVAIGDINNDGLPDIFLSGNQVKNKLYLNKGNLQFEDISESAGVTGNSSWNTGAIMGDVNGDGFLDIYVCAVVGINGFNGHNELYINNGDTTFTESAGKYELDYDSFSSSAAFFDYDGDGDLDIYLLNHAVHTQDSYGTVDQRLKRNYQTGDKLLRNDNGKFIDVSEEAGIFGGVNGYGLGIAVADFNMDGWPDIYVGNDFHEDDFYYLNNGNGTFTESLRQYFGHTSKFSMGNDVADINHDGWPDLLSLDMLPEDENVLKASQGDESIQIQKLRTERFGYYYQYTRNMLNINQQNSPYLETALLSGVAATDWSWSALFGDYNQDGEQDIFISSGIPKRPNDLDFINFVSNEQIQKKINNTKLMDQQALDLMPRGNTSNQFFQGIGNLAFHNQTGTWASLDINSSGATAMGDLDGDGDLDIVTNNVNHTATVYKNVTNKQANYLKLKFSLAGKNTFGIGTKVFSYHKGILQYKELYTTRGFQASSEPIIHFGYGTESEVDSIKIVWPDRSFQVIRNVAVNQTLTLSPENVAPFNYTTLSTTTKKLFSKVNHTLGIDYSHVEDGYVDFNRQPLIPFQFSDRGPATALGDLNNDEKVDVFFGGSKFIPAKVYVQKDSVFEAFPMPEIEKNAITEDVIALIGDFDLNGQNDILIGTGGADFYGRMDPLKDSYFLQKDGIFVASEFPEYFENASVLAPFDFNGDGFVDVFVGNQMVSGDYGKLPESFLLENNQGHFSIVENSDFKKLGMVTDAVWEDFDGDGVKDLIVVGEWMSPKFFKNNNGKLVLTNVLRQPLNGLWQRIITFDIDQDGDMDLLLGNWGTNSKFRASEKTPLKMYYSDFDGNGNSETVVAIHKKGGYYPLEDFENLSGQMQWLKKKFNTHKSFAGKVVEEIFNKKQLDQATLFTVNEIRSGFLKNEDGKFTFVPFQPELQVSPITAFVKYDFDGDGKEDVLAAGNYFGVKPLHGRFDSFPGALVKDQNSVILGHKIGLELAHKSVRHLNMITLNNTNYLLVTVNNDKVQVYLLEH
ncbi:VCBS repeat-containing protein [Arenibacter sp. GZD96]|uniref:VCBS repeat-containing protein n=1 Tax=Aurantibrevibacter litoralis TaxID=3106030 RepID=UPI002AFFC481|nr:VCBS repeat-containing protein [Arenibacter sp. GZD-96]MEA1785541.1 VCBS repeat-containing protein [Arenibacter sp. GZD-96]